MSSGFTPTYQLPYPIQTDPVNVAGDMQDLAEGVESALNLKAPGSSPSLTGVPTAPTPSVDTNTTQIATTAYVIGQGYLKSSTASDTYAALDSPTFIGNPNAPTQPSGNSSTRIATTEFTGSAVSTHSGLSSGIHGVGAGNIVGTTLIQTLTNKTIDGTLNTLQNIPQTAVVGLSGSYAPLNLSFVSASASPYELKLTDSSQQIEMNFAGANVVTVPTGTSVNLPIGTTILIAQTGPGQTTISPAVGVTVNATPGLKLRAQWSVATLVKRGANLWMAFGDLVA